MRRTSQKGIALLLLVHSLGLILTLGYALKETIQFIPQMQGKGMTEIFLRLFLDGGVGWLILGLVFLQYLRKVLRQWQKDGFSGRIMFQLYPVYYLLELFRLYGARESLSSMGLFLYLFIGLFAIQAGLSIVLYMIRSTEKPLDEPEEESADK